jgi:hypothetical protein
MLGAQPASIGALEQALFIVLFDGRQSNLRSALNLNICGTSSSRFSIQ